MILVGSRWGVEGVAAGTVVAGCLQWPVALAYAKKYGGLRVAPLIEGGLRVTALAAVAASIGRSAVALGSPQSPWGELAAASGGVVLAFLLARPLPGYRLDYQDLASLIGLLRSQRSSSSGAGAGTS